MADAKTIKMTREIPAFEGGPTSADVEPALVPEWEAAGWVVASHSPAAPAVPAAAKTDKAVPVAAKKTSKGAKK